VSVTEVGACWTQRPILFAAPTKEPDAAKRALLVLKWILVALKSQFYIGDDPTVSIKKPLNAFLGELFFASWNDGKATSNLAAEQVSHHPPITAVYMWDKENGISGEGYTCVEMKFAGSIDVKQAGHALVHIDKYDEDHLIPLPNLRVKGFLSGKLYPELYGVYHIVSSSGFVSELRFEGEGLFWGGTKNKFQAKLYSRSDPEKKTLFSVDGQWSGSFTIRDGRGSILEIYDTNAEENRPSEMTVTDVQEQDAWESRKAWNEVFDGLRDGDIEQIVTEKSKVETAQRQMRSAEAAKAETWKPLLFNKLEGDYKAFEKLGSAVGWALEKEKTKGVWKVDTSKLSSLKKPFRETSTPLG
jgi:hypothetical protein